MRTAKIALLAGALLSLGWGCLADVERVRPAPAEGAGGAGTTTVTGSPTGGAGGVSVKRTVIQKNPFGNVAKTGNLLFDGDFEWLSPFSDQYGWLSGQSPNQLGYQLPQVELGPRCRSGVKCARLAPNAVVVGMGVASQDKPLAVSVWARVVEGGCEGVEVLLVPTYKQKPLEIAATSAQPSGEWCHYGATTGVLGAAIWLYLHNVSNGDVLVDDAVVEGMTGETAGLQAPAWPSSGNHAALVGRLRALARPRVPPPSKALEAFRKARRGSRL